MSFLLSLFFFNGLFIQLFCTNIGNIPKLSFKPANSGFLLQSMTSDNGVYKQQLMLKQPLGQPNLSVSFGPLQKQITLKSSDFQPTGENSLHNLNWTEPVEPSAHIINSDLRQEDPSLHFLCHVQPKLKTKHPGAGQQSYCCVFSTVTAISSQRSFCEVFPHSRGPVCHTVAELSSALWSLPRAKVRASYLIYPLPLKSGSPSEKAKLKAKAGGKYFHPCRPHQLKSEEFIPMDSPRLIPPMRSEMREIGRSLVLQIPKRHLKTGEHFTVPIRLKEASNIVEFTLRATIPSKTFVEFVQVTLNWGISWEIKHQSIENKGSNITQVTARLKDSFLRSSPSRERRSSVFDLEFRVSHLPSASVSRVGPRIFWTLVNCRRGDSVDRLSRSPAITRLNIQSSEYRDIVAVMKDRELINTGALTGTPTGYPLHVYALRHDLSLIEVTDQASCHSNQPKAGHFPHQRCFQLVPSTGLEDGAPLASQGQPAQRLGLIVKFRRHSYQLTVRVWYPELPLRVKLSQPVLRAIRGWLVPNDDSQDGAYGWYNEQRSSDQSRWSSGFMSDFGVRSGDRLGSANPTSREKPQTRCNRRFQQAKISVHTRFISTLEPSLPSDYLGGDAETSLVDITELVYPRLSLHTLHYTTNSQQHRDNQARGPPVARLAQGWVVGQRPGLAQLRLPVVAGGRRLLGSVLVNVTEEESVGLVGLTADLVTDLSLSVSSLPGPTRAHTASLDALPHLLASVYPGWGGELGREEAVLALELRLSDGSSIPVSALTHADARLMVKALKPRLVSVMEQSDWPIVKRVAFSNTKPVSGDLLEVNLLQSSLCYPSSASRHLISPVRVFASLLPMKGVADDPLLHADWSTDFQQLQQQQQVVPLPPFASKETQQTQQGVDKKTSWYHPVDGDGQPKVVLDDKDFAKNTGKTEVPIGLETPVLKDAPGSKSKTPGLISSPTSPVDTSVASANPLLSRDAPTNKKASIASEGGESSLLGPMREMTPLEIGMYILLGVFCVAAFVFAINCGVMVARYRRHRTCPRPCLRNKEMVTTKDSSWVWMGHETLKRHSVNTKCTELLLPAEKFPGGGASGATVTPLTPPLPTHAPAIGGGAGGGGEPVHTVVASSGGAMGMVTTATASGAGVAGPSKQYTGQECSIRIMTNPLEELPHATSSLKRQHHQGSTHHPVFPPPTQPPPPIPAALRSRHVRSLLLSTAPPGQEVLPTPPVRTTSRSGGQHHLLLSQKQHQTHNSRPVSHPTAIPGPPTNLGQPQKQEALTVVNEVYAPGTESSSADGIEWDMDMRSMSHGQLMSYISNLKESVA